CVDNRINFGVDGNATANYCTSIGISRTDAGYYWDGYPGARVSNSIAYGGRYGVIGAIVSYSDMWAAGDNLGGASSLGPMVSSFDPYFGDDAYRLRPESFFTDWSVSGGQIGAYGPGPMGITSVPEAMAVRSELVDGSVRITWSTGGSAGEKATILRRDGATG